MDVLAFCGVGEEEAGPGAAAADKMFASFLGKKETTSAFVVAQQNETEEISVQATQFQRTMRRRLWNQHHKVLPKKKHKSRQEHANGRPRGAKGRFVNKEHPAEKKPKASSSIETEEKTKAKRNKKMAPSDASFVSESSSQGTTIGTTPV